MQQTTVMDPLNDRKATTIRFYYYYSAVSFYPPPELYIRLQWGYWSLDVVNLALDSPLEPSILIKLVG